jgi:hypothetical protein
MRYHVSITCIETIVKTTQYWSGRMTVAQSDAGLRGFAIIPVIKAFIENPPFLDSHKRETAPSGVVLINGHNKDDCGIITPWTINQ